MVKTEIGNLALLRLGSSKRVANVDTETTLSSGNNSRE
jgi:hypothetical protein